MAKLKNLYIEVSSITDSEIKDLNINFNPKITNLNHMTKLKKLDISGENCGVGIYGIKNLNLEELDATFNKKITNLNNNNNKRKIN